MNEKELRAQLAALEARNASLKKQKALADKIAALEAENEALGTQLAGEGAPDQEEATRPAAGPTAAETTAVTAVTAAPEPGEEVDAEAGDEPPAERPAGRRGGLRRRRYLVGVLVILSCLAVVVSGITIWTHYSVLNTDGYMRLVAPIGKNPTAIQSLSEYIAGEVVTATDLQQRTADALPPKASFLAGPITGAVDDFLTDGVKKLLSSDKAYELWLRINEVAHGKIVALLRGDTTFAYIEGSDVRLDTLPLISQALVWLDGKLPGALADRFAPPVIEPGTDPATAISQVSSWAGRPLPDDFGQVTLLKSDSLGPAQEAVRWFDTLTWVIPIVTLVLIALTVWVSRARRRTLIQLGVGVAVALIVTRVLIQRGSAMIADDLERAGGLGLARDVVGAAIGPLTTITIWIVVIGAVVAVVAWFSGRRDLQVAVVETGRRVASRSEFDVTAARPVTAWVWRHVQALRWGVLIAGLVLLAFGSWSWLWIILIIVFAVILEGALSLVAGEWPFRTSQAEDYEVE